MSLVGESSPIALRRRTSSSKRLLRSATVLVALTWIPGALAHRHPWAVAVGYTGIGWALPAALIGLATQRWSRALGASLPAVWGYTVGIAAAGVLLVGAATAIGT